MMKLTCSLFISFVAFGSFSSALAGSITLQPDSSDGKDALLVQGTYNGTDQSNLNFGDYAALSSDFIFGGANKGLIEFDLSSYTGIGMSVTNATINLYQWNTPATGAKFGIYRVLSPWNEATVTWNTAPSIESSATSIVTLDAGIDRWVQWDITTLVQDWVSGTSANYGMALMRIDNPNPQTYFISSDWGGNVIDPKLAIDYQANPVPEPATMLLLGTGLAGLIGARRKKNP